MVLAQQLIDASKDGGAAFLAFAIMVFLFAGSLFYMDKVRRRREEARKIRNRTTTTVTGTGATGGNEPPLPKKRAEY